MLPTLAAHRSPFGIRPALLTSGIEAGSRTAAQYAKSADPVLARQFGRCLCLSKLPRDLDREPPRRMPVGLPLHGPSQVVVISSHRATGRAEPACPPM